MKKGVFKAEEKLIELVKAHIVVLYVVIALVLSIAVRVCCFSYISSDMEGYLIGWYGQIEQLGKIKALGIQVGNYNVLYQTLIALMTYLPGQVVVKYKILSCIFDYVLASGVFFLLYDKNNKETIKTAIIASLIVIFSPIVFLNSSAWGQCDAIYTSFVILSFCAYKRRKYLPTFVFFGLAFAFKLQAIFYLPFYLFEWFRSKKFSFVNFLLVPLTMIVVCIPAYINGRGFWGFISPYYYQTGSCDKISFNYPSFWRLFSATDTNRAEFIATLKIPAIIITLVILAGVMVLLSKKELSEENLLLLFLIMGFTCVEFLPGMHERYAFPVEVLSIVLACKNKKTLPLALGLNIQTMFTYGVELFGGEVNLQVMAVVNFAIYIAYLTFLHKETTNSVKAD